ncbi:MAG: hypothetical protein M3076_08105 [Actinomycetota bacterium]|nr:hypothetical protein [Actinomycetota bacterium]
MYRRGERNWIRIGLLALIVLSPVLFLFGVTLLFPALNERKASGLLALFLLVAVPAMMLAPYLLFRGSGPAPGRSDDSHGGGGPPQPPSPPSAPRGGIPLQDAEPARVRLRDHARPQGRRALQRRPTRESRPAPIPKHHTG